MPTYYSSGFSKEWMHQRNERRKAYAAKLRGLGIVENSNKWRTLMYRKGL